MISTSKSWYSTGKWWIANSELGVISCQQETWVQVSWGLVYKWGKMERGIDRQSGAVSAVLRKLYQTWKPINGFTSRSTFQLSPTVMMVISHFGLRESQGIQVSCSQVRIRWNVRSTDKWVLYQSFCNVDTVPDCHGRGKALYQFVYFPTLNVMTERMRLQSFLHRVSGLTLKDRVSNSDIWKELEGVEPPLPHVKRSQWRWFGYLIRMSLGHIPLEGMSKLGGDKEHADGNTYPIRPGDALGSPRTSWRMWLKKSRWEWSMIS